MGLTQEQSDNAKELAEMMFEGVRELMLDTGDSMPIMFLMKGNGVIGIPAPYEDREEKYRMAQFATMMAGILDVDAIIEGLIDGTIDCIASDHAPHAEEEKDVESIMKVIMRVKSSTPDWG